MVPTNAIETIELESLATVIGGAHTTAAMSSQALSEASQSINPPQRDLTPSVNAANAGQFQGGGGDFRGRGASGSW